MMCDIPTCVCMRVRARARVRAHPLFYSWLNWAKRVDQEQLVSAAWGWGILHGPLIGAPLLFLSSQTEWRRRWTNRLLAVLISILIRCHFTGWLNKRDGCKRSLLVLALARRFLFFSFSFFFYLLFLRRRTSARGLWCRENEWRVANWSAKQKINSWEIVSVRNEKKKSNKSILFSAFLKNTTIFR